MKKIYLYFIAFILILSFSSCAINEVNEKAIIEGFFVQENKDSSNGQFVYTFAVPLYEKEDITQKYISVSCNSLTEAFDALEKTTAKKPFPGQNKYVILSQDLDNEQVNRIIKELSSDYEWRKDSVFFFGDESVFRYIKEEEITSDFIVGFAEIYNSKNRNISTGLFKAEKSAKEEIYSYLFPVFTVINNGFSEKEIKTIWFYQQI